MFPTYMVMGMTYDQFWNEDVELARFYREAFRLKQQMRNEKLWLQGIYFRDAIAACFSDKKNKFSYPKEPYDFAEKRKNATRERKSDDKAKAVMEMFMVNINKKFEKKGGEGNGS